MIASERGLDIDAVAVGLDPDPQVAPGLIETFPGDRYVQANQPRRVTSDDLTSAWRMITFNLAPDELPISSPCAERWDDVPAVSENLKAAREAIRRHLDHLIAGSSSSDFL
jgi:hypothetical protein